MKRAALLALVVLLGAVTCAPSPRFGSLRFGPRGFHFETRGQVFELDNGLRVALLPDPRTNLVRLDVRYSVGAAEDPVRRSGMAHLIEHLTFEMRGTESAPTIGAAILDTALVNNAFTTHDATHYWEIGLADRLPALLEIEAQRMSPRCDLLDEAVFLRERDVVLEEEAQRRDLGDDGAKLLATVWGPAHPYARSIGGREIADGTLAEACAFLDDHHAPDRATLVVTGNFDQMAARKLIADRFGSSKRHSRRARTAIEMPALVGARDEVTVETEDEQERKWIGVVLTFPASLLEDGDAEVVAQDIAARYLPSYIHPGPTMSYRSPRVWVSGGERAALVHVQVDILDGGETTIRDVEGAVVHGATKLGKWGLNGLEVERAERRNRWLRDIDGFWMRGELAAERLAHVEPGQMFEGRLRAIDAFTIESVRAWSTRTMDLKHSRLTIIHRVRPRAPMPTGRIASATGAHDLPTSRVPVDPAEASRPIVLPTAAPRHDVTDYTLPNGMRVLLAPVPGALTVDARLVFPIGDAGDGPSSLRARLAATKLHDDLTPSYERYNVERIDWVFGLGTRLDVGVSDHSTTFTAEGAALFADWHVWRLFWRLEAGIYPERGLEPLRGKARDEHDNAVKRQNKLLRHTRVLVERLFGRGHPWLDQFDADARATHDELETFRRQHYTASGATLIVSGGFDRDEMRTHIDELFGSWAARSAVAAPKDAANAEPIERAWIAIPDRDQPQVRATIAFGGLPVDVDRAAREVLVEMLAERVKAVREQQGASYGVNVGAMQRGPRAVLLIDGSLDPERAGRALTTMLEAASSLETGGADLATELVRARRAVLVRALADGGSPAEIAGQLEDAVRRRESLETAAHRADEIAKVTLADVTRIAARDLATSRRIVIVSGPSESARAALVAAGVSPDEIKIER